MTKNRWKYKSYHNLNTHQERVANCEIREDGQREKWGRAKRNPYKLDPWVIEKPYGFQKSWKKLRATKYHEAGLRNSSNEHTICVKDRRSKLELTDYFKKHNIPYSVTRIGKKIRRTWTKYIENRFVGYEKFFYYDSQNQLRSYNIPQYIPVVITPIRRSYWRRITYGYEITWWSFKDIGIEFILKGVSNAY